MKLIKKYLPTDKDGNVIRNGRRYPKGELDKQSEWVQGNPPPTWKYKITIECNWWELDDLINETIVGEEILPIGDDRYPILLNEDEKDKVDGLEIITKWRKK